MKQKTKALNLRIEYNDVAEMLKCIEQILKDMRRTNFDRQLVNGCIYEWGVNHTEIEHYKEELIDDKWCIVIQSKMNDK